ncbi:MAG: DUF2934 domain-containing protein [Nitrospiraceae bacterium]|jgi:hypothetical protein|nr:DUF2934 domain-containing protein [Nitrospiraceae bacterium]MCS6284438.1 DUF2934 domain-containing protein [Nitrospira sp.]OQW67037.1 MAG: hypothetical protein BVN29_05270 [Nitrospira sp. ST-bin5]
MPKKPRSSRKASPAGPEHSRPKQVREEIRSLAYELYCQCGHEDGHDLDHWMEAERRVLEHQAQPKSRG